MAFDLGALVTRMTVEGRGQFEADVNAGGQALARAARQGDDFGLSLGTMTTGTARFGAGLGLVGGELLGLGERSRIAFQTIGTGATIAGLAVGALVGLSVAKYAEYDAAISRSIAVTGAYGQELDDLRQLTLDLGGATIFTATEAAQGVTELGKAGIDTSDILGGALAGSLNLAAAGELAVADAAAVTSSTLKQFNLEGRDATHVSDLLAAGAGNALGSVSDLGLALKQSGLVASQMGLSVEETTGTLAAFAAAGLLGSDAGTSFRTMLLNLATPTAQQTELMQKYGIEAYKAGNFVGIASLAAQLRSGELRKASQAERDYALGIIFGSDAIRAANVLYNEGEAGIREWISTVDDAGYAARIAGVNTDNLAGDLERLQGALDTALIGTGSGANGVLRDLVQTVTELVDGFTELPPELQQVILLGAALTAGGLLLVGSLTLGISKAIEFRAAMALIRAEMPLTTAAAGRFASFLTGPWGIAIAAASVGVLLLTDYLESLKVSSSELRNSLVSSANAAEIFDRLAQGRDVTAWADVRAQLRDLPNLLEQAAMQSENFWTRFGGREYFGAIQALSQLGDELAELSMVDLPGAQDAFNKLAAETDGSQLQLWRLLSSMPAYREALIEQANALGINVTSTDEATNKQRLLELAMGTGARSTTDAADAYLAANDEAAGLRDTLAELLDVLDEANGKNQDAITANIDYQETLREVDEAIANARAGVEGYGLTLDTTTEAGGRNMGMLVDLAKNAWDAAEAQLAVDGDTARFQATLEASRAALVQRAIDLGYTTEQAQALADSILRIPSKHETEIIAETAAAQRALDNFFALNNGRVIRASVQTQGTSYTPGFAYGGIVRAMAGGGIMSNAGQLAQIRRAGDVTVWAEHDTGGEAYIPFALDRRERSEAILAAVAREFGGTYLPAGARAMAGGGISSQQLAPATTHETRVFIGDRELRVVAREEVTDVLTELTVQYEGGSNV